MTYKEKVSTFLSFNELQTNDLPYFVVDVVSVEQGVANTFQLRSFSDVVVRKVDFDSVVLDSLEITFKDQYLGRSEMWRLRNNIVNSSFLRSFISIREILYN